ncbi:SPOR domain-containing protein [Sphingomonas canadensis]|uniref:SPOR domain-containing protein n=1 Tax=Sphingomonas canadensis TaxID=1219257 RepID=A0ABW3H307_9SPHN|nr:SPOR domain-containing protein [Sphingomonas canadensis]MCW3835834.1 SPOR domain-containing protein [Sphingomonas canadensis]
MGMRAGEGFGDDDRLPWLETVEEDYREGPSIWRILLLIFIGVAVLAVVVFGIWIYQRQQAMQGNGALIAAPEGDYKVKPDEPGGLNVEGEGTAVYGASQGESGNVAVNMGARPEEPVTGKTVPAAQPSPGGGTMAVPDATKKLEAKLPPGGSGALMQLGAFPDEAGAEAAWARLTRKFPVLAPLGKAVERGTAGSATVYRLRVNAGSNAQAKDICARLIAAGENCYVAN